MGTVFGYFFLFVLSYFFVACLFSNVRKRINVDLGSSGKGRGREYNDQNVSSEKNLFSMKIKIIFLKVKVRILERD